MPRVCTICHNAQRENINFDLLAHEQSYGVIAKKYTVSEDALKRHVANHLKPLIQELDRENRAKDKAAVMRTLDALDHIILSGLSDDHTAEINPTHALRALEMKARITGEDSLPAKVTFVWGKGLDKDDDMEITGDLKEFDIVKSRDRAEEADEHGTDKPDAEDAVNSASI
jgi:hypothetical protein